MNAKPLLFLMLSLICLFASFAYSFFYPTANFYSTVPLTVAVIGFFLMGTALFGYLSFVPHILFGLALGAEKNAAIFIYLLPIAIATYAGAKLGVALEADFRKQKYFLNEGKKILGLLALSLVIAFAIEVAMPIIISYLPQDLWGMSVKEGKNVWGMFSQLTTLIKN